MGIEKLKNTLQLAIDFEWEAYEFYNKYAEKSTNEKMRSIFQELAMEEMSHKETLEDIFYNNLLSEKISEVVNFNELKLVAEPDLAQNLNFVEAINLAIKKEEESMALYEGFAIASEEFGESQIFKDLAQMERNHINKLKEILDLHK